MYNARHARLAGLMSDSALFADNMLWRNCNNLVEVYANSDEGDGCYLSFWIILLHKCRHSHCHQMLPKESRLLTYLTESLKALAQSLLKRSTPSANNAPNAIRTTPLPDITCLTFP